MMRTEPFNASIIKEYTAAALNSMYNLNWTPELMKLVAEAFDIAAYLDSILEEASEVSADD